MTEHAPFAKQIQVSIAADIDRGGFGVTDPDEARNVLCQAFEPAELGSIEPMLDAGNWLVDFTEDRAAEILAHGALCTVNYEGRVFEVDIEAQAR